VINKDKKINAGKRGSREAWRKVLRYNAPTDLPVGALKTRGMF
jgi:hypothetical protein